MGKRAASRKHENEAAVEGLTAALERQRGAFLGLRTYNDAKKFARRRGGCGNLVDNGQRFLNLMTKSLARANDSALQFKWRQLQAEHRAEREAQRSGATALRACASPGSLSASLKASGALARQPAMLSADPLSLSKGIEEGGQEVGHIVASDSSAPRESTSGIKVMYAKTDNTTGYKEFGCVVLRTTESNISYYGDIYEPREGCKYEVMHEVTGYQLSNLIMEEPVCDMPGLMGWVSSPLKERVIKAWMESKNNAAK